MSRIPPYGGNPIVPVTFVIAKEGSSLDITRADYVCSAASTSDQTTINTAISALPAVGGIIQLLEGTFIIDGDINLNSNVSIIGNGFGTTIKIKDGINVAVNMLNITAKTYVLIESLQLDGNQTNRIGGVQKSILLSGSNYCNIEGLRITDVNDETIELANTSQYNIISMCMISASSFAGAAIISINTASSRNEIINNMISTSARIAIKSTSGENLIATNNIRSITNHAINIDTTTLNTVSCNSIDLCSWGIYLDTAEDCIVEGNHIGNSTNEAFYLTASDYNVVKNNFVYSAKSHGIRVDTSDYNLIDSNFLYTMDFHGIYVDNSSNDNSIVDNYIIYSSQAATNTFDQIRIDNDADNNNVQGNMCRHLGAAKQAKYGINVANANCDTNLVTNNDLLTSGQTASFNDAGTATVTAAGNRL